MNEVFRLKLVISFFASLQWDLFRYTELDCWQTMLKRLFKREVEQVVMRYEEYGQALQRELERRQKQQNRHSKQGDSVKNMGRHCSENWNGGRNSRTCTASRGILCKIVDIFICFEPQALNALHQNNIFQYLCLYIATFTIKKQ